MSSLAKFSAAGLAALALATGTVASTAALSAPVALAAPTANPDPAVNPSTINPNGTFELNVTKYLGATTGNTNDGTQQTITGRDLLQGVPFDIYKVGGVDLTTNEGWTAATALQGHTITAAEISAGQIVVNGVTYPLTKVSTITTDANGNAVYDGPAGLYLMNENLTGATVTNMTTGAVVPVKTITPSLPALVTLPMTNPTDTSLWMDTVYVYPKNASDTITKAVDDKQTVTGDQTSTAIADKVATFTLTGTITPSLTGTQMGSYVMIDQLDPRLGYKSVDSVTVGGTTLALGTDYTVSVLDADGTAGGEYVQIIMTASGLDKLAAAKAADTGATVVAKLSTDILVEGSGTIENTVSLLPNQSAVDQVPGQTPGTPYTPPTTPPTEVPGTPSDPTVSKYGDLALTKTDGLDGSGLAGAEFSLFSVLKGSSATDQAACDAATVDPAKAIMTGITTGAAGTVTVKGLQQSDWYNNAQQSDPIVYCLVETKAPAGYNLLAKSVPFTITQVASAGATQLTVKNEKTNLDNNLPLTGGTGAAALGVGGVALLGAGLALVVTKKRRESSEPTEA